MAKMTLEKLAIALQRHFSESDDSAKGIYGTLESIDHDIDQYLKGEQWLTFLESFPHCSHKKVAKAELKIAKKRIELFEKRTIQDDNATAFELEKLKKRVKILEEKLKLVH